MDTSDADELSDAAETLVEFRASFEVFLEGWKRIHGAAGAGTAGFCRGASQALVRVMREEFPWIEWRLDGGYGEEATMADRAEMERRARGWIDLERFPGGMTDTSGAWNGHYWVVGRFGGDDFVFDMTADQFGWDPAIVAAGSDERYRSNNARDRIDGFFTSFERDFGILAATEWRSRVSRDRAPGI